MPRPLIFFLRVELSLPFSDHDCNTVAVLGRSAAPTLTVGRGFGVSGVSVGVASVCGTLALALTARRVGVEALLIMLRVCCGAADAFLDTGVEVRSFAEA